jgi:putative PIN family toxin of toxin-antitoxin system
MALAGDINLTVSQSILEEMADIPARKFDASPAAFEEARFVVKAAARTVRPSVLLNVIKEDPSDDSILECAVSAGSDFIVTGDRDLLRLGVYNGIRILNPAELMSIVTHRQRR